MFTPCFDFLTDMYVLFQVIMALLKFWPKVHSPKEVIELHSVAKSILK